MKIKKALLIYPEFPRSFWKYTDVCLLAGAKHPASPLGIITVAAMLPQEWELRFIDMNVAELEDSDIKWADIVFISGMLPQQANFLKLVDRVHGKRKKVVAGGPDPTSQPKIYRKADYLVLGEAEITLAPFLADLESGVQGGIYSPNNQKPDVTKSPIPRFDLLNFDDYLLIGIQTSRGCPFNCEFCDIIELYGRRVRSKNPDQVIREIDALYNLGYRGQIDFVDDNFVGNKRKAKAILRAVRDWSKPRKHPFFFSTEASIDVVDDDELLELFHEMNLRHVFIGIETTDDNLLKDSNKIQNTSRPMAENVKKLQQHGIVVLGGFIVGFDNETSQAARAIAEFIQESNICIAMVGLLFAIPNTQLTRRLIGENRLFEGSYEMDAYAEAFDQTTTGLNFVTKRPRKQILEDYLYIMNTIYSKRNYFNRCLQLGKSLRMNNKHKVTFKEYKKRTPAFFRFVCRLGFNRSTAYHLWRNFFLTLIFHPTSIEEVFNMMAMYVHFEKHREHVAGIILHTLRENTDTRG